ncbi:helix-turn-helix domain-containing protein [Marinimicrobium alkaliphilum]|uniref:helix-turn-helix domain-containing protein n=1 Tax=Marinimicrobium alkaliphilum TaxID=2202654 RepID=UPI0018E08F23|nr:helix-turn-helix domain-containing protein [Marinimicrobium alkaliphilum]
MPLFSGKRFSYGKTIKPADLRKRCEIYVLNRSGLSQREIAPAVDVSQSTISRELAKNLGDRDYHLQKAHAKVVEQRPPTTEERSRVGGWGIDTVICKCHSGTLLTLVDRATKSTVLAQTISKSASDVTRSTIALARSYKEAAHTIITDNGKEFVYHEKITKARHGPAEEPRKKNVEIKNARKANNRSHDGAGRIGGYSIQRRTQTFTI